MEPLRRRGDQRRRRRRRLRPEVALGDEHLDCAIESTTEFTADFHDLITRYAWGEIWARRASTGRRAASRRPTRPSRDRAARPRRGLMHTRVGIVGAGPPGLTLGRLLELERIESVILEDRRRGYVEARIRAGVLEQGVADLLVEAGVGERLQREAIVHDGIGLQFEGERHRVPLRDLTGKSIVIYGLTEIVKDLIAARLACGDTVQCAEGAGSFRCAGSCAVRR
jgi:FAD binding domain